MRGKTAYKNKLNKNCKIDEKIKLLNHNKCNETEFFLYFLRTVRKKKRNSMNNVYPKLKKELENY